MSNNTNPKFSRVVHRLALAMTVVTFPLIVMGGLVTTHDAGMAVPDWPNTYGYNMFLYPWQSWVAGPVDLFEEHGHRLLGTAVGFLAIGLVIAAFLFESRRWMKWWSVGILLAVIAQGVLGGARVVMDERTFAMIHGCTGPMFFALAAVTCAMTSKWWRDVSRVETSRDWISRLAIISPIVILVQLVAGAQLRHMPLTSSPRSFVPLVHIHLTLAVLVSLFVITLAVGAYFSSFRKFDKVRGPSTVLLGLVVIQVLLGCGAWIANYALPWQIESVFLAKYVIAAQGAWETAVVTGHQATGSLIIATATILAVRILRQSSVATMPAAA